MNTQSTDNTSLASTVPEPEAAPTRLIDIHVYTYDWSLEKETQCVESARAESEAEPEQPEVWNQRTKPLKKRLQCPLSPLFLVLTALFILMIMAGGLVSFFLFLPTATITVVPKSVQIQTTGTIAVVSGTANGTRDEIPGRMLSSITMSQTHTAATTGRTILPARPGRGTITFYNAALSPQTLVAGTLLSGSSGIQVVTGQDIIVPAATYPTFGEAHVPAHAVQLGEAGNIKAGDIYGPCCLLNIQAVSSAFDGGQAAQDYQSVSKSDIDTTEASLKTELRRRVSAALQTQVQSRDTLLIPPQCSPFMSADHEVGDRATQVQVTVTQSCTGIAYETQAFRQLVTLMQTQEALHEQSEHYSLSGEVQTTIPTVILDPTTGSYRLSVQSRGTWIYQLSQAELSHLAARIAGRSPKQATQLLRLSAGVQDVSLSNIGGATLPSDPQKIHFLLVQS
jgi:hypothetical protein